MITRNGLNWHREGFNIMVRTESFGASDGSTDYTYLKVTRADLVKMLKELDPRVEVLTPSELATRVIRGS